MEVESTASQHTQYARKHGNGLRTSKEGDRQAHQNGEYAGYRKKDTVEISPAARFAAVEIINIKDLEEEKRKFFAAEMEKHGDDFLKKVVNGDYGGRVLPSYIVNDLLSDEQRAEYNQLHEQRREQQRIEAQKQAVSEYLVYKESDSAEYFIFNALNGKAENAFDIAVQLGKMVFASQRYETPGKDLEATAADRAAGRDLAKYIAENYFDDPEEAEAFMDKINKFIKNSELRDQGYIIYFADGDPMKPNPPRAFDMWLEKKGLTDKYYELGSKWVNDHDYEAREEFLKIFGEYIDDGKAYCEKNQTHPLYKVSQTYPTWEEIKEMSCDPKCSMFSQEYKAWYAAFDAQVNLVQSIVDKVNQITDFSGNEKWNNIMNLLSKAM